VTLIFSGSVWSERVGSWRIGVCDNTKWPKGWCKYKIILRISTLEEYDEPNAVIAAMLNPVNSATLKSTTIIKELTDGSKLDFESFKTFQGHIKVHLASDGPDYKVILVSGHVGNNSIRSSKFWPLQNCCLWKFILIRFEYKKWKATNWLPFCGFWILYQFRIKGKVISKSVSPPAWIKFFKIWIWWLLEVLSRSCRRTIRILALLNPGALRHHYFAYHTE